MCTINIPCNIGTMIYILPNNKQIRSYRLKHIVEGRVDSIYITNMYTYLGVSKFYNADIYSSVSFYAYDIVKTIFLNKEDAEKAFSKIDIDKKIEEYDNMISLCDYMKD